MIVYPHSYDKKFTSFLKTYKIMVVIIY